MRKDRGMGLLEVLASMTLFLLASGVLFALFSRMSSWRDHEANRREEIAGFLVAGSKLKSLLREAPFDTVSATYPSGDPLQGDLALAFASSRDVDGTWMETNFVPDDSTRVLFHRDASRDLILEHRVIGSPPSQLFSPLTPAEILTEIAAPETGVVARNIESLQLIHPTTDTPTALITTPLKLRIASSGRAGQDSRSVERTVSFSR